MSNQPRSSEVSLREALAALVAKLDAVGPYLTTLHAMAEIRGYRYNGPNYGAELEAARRCLDAAGPEHPAVPATDEGCLSLADAAESHFIDSDLQPQILTKLDCFVEGALFAQRWLEPEREGSAGTSEPDPLAGKSCNQVPPGNGYCDHCAAGHYERCRYVRRAPESTGTSEPTK